MDKVQMAVMWNIIREVANMDGDGYIYTANNGQMTCIFCNDSWGWAANDKHTHDHKPDCIVLKARALVEQEASHE